MKIKMKILSVDLVELTLSPETDGEQTVLKEMEAGGFWTFSYQDTDSNPPTLVLTVPREGSETELNKHREAVKRNLVLDGVLKEVGVTPEPSDVSPTTISALSRCPTCGQKLFPGRTAMKCPGCDDPQPRAH